MKNTLLLSILFFFSGLAFSYGQGICPEEIRLSEDGTCLFVKWNPFIEAPENIMANGVSYVKVGDTMFLEDWYRYSPRGETVSDSCDILSSDVFVGEFLQTIQGIDIPCNYSEAGFVMPCPDDIMISETENCLLVFKDTMYTGSMPDTVVLRDTTYWKVSFTDSTALYLRDTNTNMCPDSASLAKPLNATLYIGNAVCVYKDGILPINILAFDYTNSNDQINLNWEVNAEEPTRRLALQKSYNGVDWTEVYHQNLDGMRMGQSMKGNFEDRDITQSRVFYRLAIAGWEGKSMLSYILPVTMKDQVISSLYFERGNRSIVIKAGKNYTGQMDLINIHGQQIMSEKIRILENNSQEVRINRDLTPGIYFVRFEDGMIPPVKLFID